MSTNILNVPDHLLGDDNHPETVSLPAGIECLQLSSAPQYTLYRLVRELKPKHILEIGTQSGASAVAMALAQRDNGTPVDVTCVDPFLSTGDNDGVETLSFFYDNINKSGYLSKGINLHLAFSKEFLANTKQIFDFVVIDGSHHYEDVKYDFEHVLPLTKLGGYIWLHDYIIYESVRNACNEVVVARQLPFSVNDIQMNSRGDLCGWALARNLPYQHLRGQNNIEIKLNLGCGQDYKEDCINVDLDPKAKADLRINFLDIDQVFATNSVSEVYMCHSIGYLSLWDAQELFRKINTILKPNGKLIIETPNLERAVDKIISSNHKLPDYIEGVRPFHAFGLDQLEAKENYSPYKFSWSPWHLELELKNAGLRNISVLPPQTHSAWRDMRVEATKGEVTIRSGHTTPSHTIAHKTALVIYDSHLGHTTMYVRGLTHKQEFEKNGWRVNFIDYRSIGEDSLVRFAEEVSVVYLLKVNSLTLVEGIKTRTKAKVVFDLADALWQPLHRQAGWHDLEQILQRVDCIFVENEFIGEYGRKFNKTKFVPIVTNVEQFDAARKRFPRTTSDTVRVGWLGSTGTFSGMVKLRPLIDQVLQNHPNVELRIVGCEDPLLLKDFQHLRFSVLPKYNEAQMFEEIVQFDIGLFPPPFDDEDYLVRGAQKALLYMQGGVPPLALNLGDCSRFIEDGKTGMLVSKPSDWGMKLEQLINSATIRREIGDLASAKIRLGHSHAEVFSVLERSFLEVMGG
jgi:glycosyltransferase involved in cell wall biosynthesis